jgi:phosphonatase-like hydrolase
MDRRKLVVFDVAGTTVQDDDIVLKAFTGAFDRYGVRPSAAEVNAVMGMAKKTAIGQVLHAHDSKVPVDRVYGEFMKLMAAAYREGPLQEIPGASEVFRKLKAAGYHVALDTGFPRDILDIVLDRLAWKKEKLVDATIASDEVSAGRPYPYMIFNLMTDLRISRTEDVTKVGDTLVDVEEGLGAGCGLVVGVTSGTCTEKDFTDSGLANFVILPDVTKLPKLMKLEGG